MPRYYIVDGLIAAGKTTLLKTLKDIDLEAKISVIYEPVDHWKETGNLERFYKALTIKDSENRSAQIYRFQTYVFQSRIKSVLEGLKQPADIYFIERSIFSDRHIFMQMLYESNMVTESDYRMYIEWWELWEHVLPFSPDGFIYLNPDTDECMKRHASRARLGETIDKQYQERLRQKHDEYFDQYITINGKNVPVFNLKTDVDFRDGVGKQQILNTVKRFIEEGGKRASARLFSVDTKNRDNNESEGNRYIYDNDL